MKELILDQCSTKGTCLLDRKQFDASFSGHDLTIQVRSAIDFAQQNGLAFGRSSGDQHFVFSRLPKLEENNRPERRARKPGQRGNRRRSDQQKPAGSSARPFGRSF